MPLPPDFLTRTQSLPGEVIYRPFTPNRRGERVAWACTGFLGVTVVVIIWRGATVSIFALMLLFFFLLASLLISYGNWMDTRLAILTTSQHVYYRSPLRKVELVWDAIVEMRVVKAGRGWRVAVIGHEGYFTFRMGCELRGRSGQRLRIGIDGGERLAAHIRSKARFSTFVREGEMWVCRREQPASD
jgi:hypothetical protein